ncbi:actin family protein [Nitzschia inconspicua]|uniref:Actin family protein n=1 Tax=Nitzschia inconspicua TaxID=303405 RepID=A0A9K3PBN4_9STRA|nr:actin family protein [Nitzschia inconspicua]
MKYHSCNSLLSDALNGPSLDHRTSTERNDNDDASLEELRFDQQLPASQNSDNHEKLSLPLEGDNSDNDDHLHNDYDPGPLSPPSGVASYMLYFPGGVSNENKKTIHSSTRSSNGSSQTTHPPPDDSFSSYVAASSMSSFDTPRIDNVNPSIKVSNKASSGISMNSWLTSRSSHNSLLGGMDDQEEDPAMLPRHSDFTVPTSNNNVLKIPSAPPTLHDPEQAGQDGIYSNHIKPNRATPPSTAPNLHKESKAEDSSPGRRSILGSSVGKKYRVRPLPTTRLSPSVSPARQPPQDSSFLERSHISPSQQYQPGLSLAVPMIFTDLTQMPPTSYGNQDPLASPSNEQHSAFHSDVNGPTISLNLQPDSLSPLTPAYPYNGATKENPKQHPKHTRSSSRMQPRVVPMSYQHQDTPRFYEANDIPEDIFRYSAHAPKPAVHETIHAQSLLLGVAFMAVWLPNNVMAPNLTQMADFFEMTNDERDLYLGSYCALAVGVFSLPLSALFGFMADFYSRKYLFVACVLCGAVSATWTGLSKNYWSLFFARLCSGGCMSGSVPVAFSLLGDLFSTEERNAASSGLTAMMGLGIIAGQVYAGMVGPTKGWQYPFYVSAVLQLVVTLVIAMWVAEPIRGGKEKALQDMFKSGSKYDRQLTLEGFIHAMRENASNSILLWQGFFTSLPWGIVFVFLNDYLSQEKGFSVPEATFMVMLFGVGCAIGGIAGGYIGQLFMVRNRSFLPLYMAAATFLGIFPFLELLNSKFPNHSGYKAKALSIIGGCVASLPSVNVRPCILNVNPPETRGAALTAANLLVTLGRGIGPSCIVVMGSLFQVSRQFAFNVTLAGFWTIAAIQLVFLARTLPIDQDTMEASLAQYAATARGDIPSSGGRKANSKNAVPSTCASGSASPVNVETTSLLLPATPGGRRPRTSHEDGESIMSIEDCMTSFDGTAASRSLQFVRMGIRELSEEITYRQNACLGCEAQSEDDEDPHNAVDDGDLDEFQNSILHEDIPQEELVRRRNLWLQQQRKERTS